MAGRRRKKSLKKLIDDAVNAAERRSTTVGKPILKEIDELVWHEDEIVIYSADMADLPGKVYRTMGAGLKRRGFRITKQKEVELRGERLVYVNRYIVEGEGAGEEAMVYAKLKGLSIVETA